jgi:hypothetical protein
MDDHTSLNSDHPDHSDHENDAGSQAERSHSYPVTLFGILFFMLIYMGGIPIIGWGERHGMLKGPFWENVITTIYLPIIYLGTKYDWVMVIIVFLAELIP